MEQLAKRPGGWKKKGFINFDIFHDNDFNNSLFSSRTQYIVDFLLHRESFRSLRFFFFFFRDCYVPFRATGRMLEPVYIGAKAGHTLQSITTSLQHPDGAFGGSVPLPKGT